MGILMIYLIFSFKAQHLNTVIYLESCHDRNAVRLPAYSEGQVPYSICGVHLSPPPYPLYLPMHIL
jgi:hypothetical protein